MNRRDFLQRLGLAAGAIVLSPMLDFAPIELPPSATISASDLAVFDSILKDVYMDAIAADLARPNVFLKYFREDGSPRPEYA